MSGQLSRAMLLSGLLTGIDAGAAGTDLDELLLMTPEQLGNVQVTSVSKQMERLADVPASVYVISAEAIRRSGATSVFDALRLAPNLHVASEGTLPGIATARGHASGFYTANNKLLVLVDGRSVYSPFFSGVFWDAFDLVLEDVDRIEVLSGPAGVTWGTNAVNGVISIITRSAARTRGQLASVTLGQGGSDVVVRHGGRLGEAGDFRVHAKTIGRPNSFNGLTGAPIDDGTHRKLVGARADLDRAGGKLSMQFNAYDGAEGQAAPGNVDIGLAPPLPAVTYSGVSASALWTRQTDDGGSIALQGYLDFTRRSMMPAIANYQRLIDLEVQRILPAMGAHKITLGSNVRYSIDEATNGATFGFLPARVNQHWYSFFGQDEIRLREDLRLTLGARFERGAYNTRDFLPSARLAWKLDDKHLLWSGVSRAARAPARLDVAVRFPLTPPYFIEGVPDPRSEIVDAVELGYRYQGPKGSVSATVFRNFYDHLVTVEFANFIRGAYDGKMISNGIEVWGDWQVAKRVRVSAGATALQQNFMMRDGKPDLFNGAMPRFDPAHTAQLRVNFDIAPGVDAYIGVRRASQLATLDVPSYNAIDGRIGWRLSKQLEFSLIGRNILGTSHEEWKTAATRGKVPTQLLARLVWRH